MWQNFGKSKEFLQEVYTNLTLKQNYYKIAFNENWTWTFWKYYWIFHEMALIKGRLILWLLKLYICIQNLVYFFIFGNSDWNVHIKHRYFSLLGKERSFILMVLCIVGNLHEFFRTRDASVCSVCLQHKDEIWGSAVS